jgi:hypothetical protein
MHPSDVATFVRNLPAAQRQQLAREMRRGDRLPWGKGTPGGTAGEGGLAVLFR